MSAYAWRSDAERRNQVRSDRDDEVRNRDSDDESTSEDYSDDEVFIMDRDRKEGRARRNGRVRQNDTDLTDTDTDSDDESRDDTEKEGAREEPNESCTVCGGPVEKYTEYAATALDDLMAKIRRGKIADVKIKIEGKVAHADSMKLPVKDESDSSDDEE